MSGLSIIGQRVPRADGPAKVTGEARYAGDISLPGLLVGKILGSTLPHARIINVDTSLAQRLPGVKAVFDDNCVLYFKPGDERDLADRILELYHNPEKSAALSSSAQTLYQQYHWPVMKQRYLKVYQQLLG